MAASLTKCKARRGSTRSGGPPDQERIKSQVPKRKCSGSKSQTPTWLPEILSANAWRICRSRLLGIGWQRALFFEGPLGLNKLRRVGGIKCVEFFLQAVIGDDPFDAALADAKRLLTEFLSDDLRGRLRIQEAAADDQTDDLMSAPVIGLGPWATEEQTLSAFFIKSVEDLVVTLAGQSIFLSGFGRAEAFALALDEHGQAATDLIVVRNEERAAGAREAELLFGQHDVHGRNLRQRELCVKLHMAE